MTGIYSKQRGFTIRSGIEKKKLDVKLMEDHTNAESKEF